MDANTSYSDSSGVADNPRPPPKSMKMRQATMLFSRVEQTQSSPGTFQCQQSECHTTASSVSSTIDQDLHTSEEYESATVCFSDSCKKGLSPYQPNEPSVIEGTRKQQGKKTRHFCITWYSTYHWLTLCVTRAKVFCLYCRHCSNKKLLSMAKNGVDAFYIRVSIIGKKLSRSSTNIHSRISTRKPF